jgi:ribonuclease P protein component
MRKIPEVTGRRAPVTFPPVPRLKRRADFLRANEGERFHTRAFSLRAAPLSEAIDPAQTVLAARFGITVTKRIGGAVQRNRIKRRFKEALRLSPDLPARAGRDYVIVAKVEALTADFQALRSELSHAIRKIDRPTRPKPAKAKPVSRESGRA